MNSVVVRLKTSWSSAQAAEEDVGRLCVDVEDDCCFVAWEWCRSVRMSR